MITCRQNLYAWQDQEKGHCGLWNAGLINGEQLQAEGVLLDQKLSAVSIMEARSAAYAKLAIPCIQDWVVDYSEQPCIWIVTTHAWYR